MSVLKGSVEELCFAAEGLSGTAAAASLRKLGTLAQNAPAGRLFGAIATLSDMSAKAAKSLEDGSFAMQSGDDQRAALNLAKALAHIDDMAGLASDQPSHEQPAFLRKMR